MHRCEAPDSHPSLMESAIKQQSAVDCSLLPEQQQLNICQYLQGAVITVMFELSALTLCWHFGDPRF